MEELLAFLKIKCERARGLLNTHYMNDSGRSCEDWAKGSLSAYTEVRNFVQGKLKEGDYNEADGKTYRADRDEETRSK